MIPKRKEVEQNELHIYLGIFFTGENNSWEAKELSNLLRDVGKTGWSSKSGKIELPRGTTQA